MEGVSTALEENCTLIDLGLASLSGMIVVFLGYIYDEINNDKKLQN